MNFGSTTPKDFEVPDSMRPVPGKWRYLVPSTAPPGTAWEDAYGNVYFVTGNRAGKPAGVVKVPPEKVLSLEIRGVPLYRPHKIAGHGVRYFEIGGRRPNGKAHTEKSVQKNLPRLSEILLTL